MPPAQIRCRLHLGMFHKSANLGAMYKGFRKSSSLFLGVSGTSILGVLIYVRAHFLMQTPHR